MIQLHPQISTQDGQKVAVLSYDEFLKVQEILEDLRQAKDETKDSPNNFLEEIEQI
ncbi:MAG: type II toxin-antitoxin system Phd/YefM family antitoxin [Microcystaceae cyanobacterium]